MNLIYLQRLPQDILELVRFIEKSSGINIDVEVRAPVNQNDIEQREVMKCEMDQHSARIITPRDEYFPDGAVLHELLHIRRILVEQKPRLIFCDDCDDWNPQFESAITNLDNSLEHLLIVPEEIMQRPERSAYWINVMRRVFNELPSKQMDIDDKYRHALVNFVFVSMVLNDSGLVKIAYSYLQHFGVADQADALIKSVESLLHTKENLALLYAKNLSLPVDRMCLRYIDTKLGIARDVHLATQQ